MIDINSLPLLPGNNEDEVKRNEIIKSRYFNFFYEEKYKGIKNHILVKQVYEEYETFFFPVRRKIVSRYKTQSKSKRFTNEHLYDVYTLMDIIRHTGSSFFVFVANHVSIKDIAILNIIYNNIMVNRTKAAHIFLKHYVNHPDRNLANVRKQIKWCIERGWVIEVGEKKILMLTEEGKKHNNRCIMLLRRMIGLDTIAGTRPMTGLMKVIEGEGDGSTF
jgi:hypothetical protein